jgi:hypothetical protein
MGGDFEIRFFDLTAPDDLFKDFSSKPQLWCIDIPDEVGRYAVDRKSFLAVGWLRSRPADCPVVGRAASRDFSNEVMDSFAVVGTFEEASLPPRRYRIDCVIESGTDSNGATDFMMVSKAATGDKARLRYTGPAPEVLLVFSRAISEQLVELVIINMR